MRCNEAWWDRAIRLVVGSGLLWAASRGHAWGFIGVLQLATAASGHCVLYRPFGWDTTKLFKRDASVERTAS
jgi:hypothetical protein